MRSRSMVAPRRDGTTSGRPSTIATVASTGLRATDRVAGPNSSSRRSSSTCGTSSPSSTSIESASANSAGRIITSFEPKE